ncbi:MAG TPA: condensation domain-containing protein, partial [Chthonomonadaceae bacterium]|nr:condensation domain-containing protein [Chthonomonadaceae bacterium]
MSSNMMEGYRLSPHQHRLWATRSLHTTNSICVILITGTLEPEALKATLLDLVRRHEVLRTVYRRPPGMRAPLQVILDESEICWQYIDRRNEGPETDIQDTKPFVQAERERVFNLEHGPLLSATLVRFSEDRAELILAIPALCADCRSLLLLVRDLFKQLYVGAPLPADAEEAVQFVQFSEWHNELLQTPEAAEFRSREPEEKVVSAIGTQLPFSADPGDRQTFMPEILPIAFDSDLLTKSELLTRRGWTLADFLRACWVALISRLTATRDVRIGLYFDGREFEEIQDAVGLFARYVPVRFSLQAEEPFATVLKRVQETTQELSETHTYVDLSGFVDAEGNPLPFGLAFSYEARQSEFVSDDAVFTITQFFGYPDRVALSLQSVQTESALMLELHYDPACYGKEEIQRLAGQFVKLLQSALAQPDAPIDTLDILPQDQRHQLLVEWNQTGKDFPNLCVHHLFERFASSNPDAIALVAGGKSLTYRELNNRANQLAHWLYLAGVQPNNTVGLFLYRSIEAIVGLLAILKAGAAYLPLDPAFPKERLQFMLKDSQTNLVLTQQS